MPLLADGQDPNGLAARVAYHLHRHGISIKELNQAEITFEMARQLRQGTLQINNDFVAQMGAALHVEPEELSRPLQDDEKTEWNFYRESARHVTEVWRRIAEASTAHKYSQHRLGELLGISQSVISRAMRGERKSPVLNWQDASAIATALNIEEGAEAFLYPEFARDDER